jgi:sucrose-6-phosphatase
MLLCLLVHPFLFRTTSILVANAHEDVIEQSQRQAKELGNTNYLYLAKGGFLGMNGNYSAGILEGITHYHPDIQKLLV